MAKRKIPNQPFEANVDDLSHEGKGVARQGEKVVFIDGALPGEEVVYKIHKRRRSYDEGHVLEIKTASDLRVEPKCEYFGLCGGCSLQHLSAEEQIKFKQKGLLDNIRKMAHLEPPEVLPPLRCEPWGYRRKARLGVRYVEKKERVLVGFRERRSPYLADLARCEVLYPTVGLHLEALSQLIASLSIYNEIPQIEVSIGDEVQVLIFRHMSPLNESDLQNLRTFGEQHQFQIWLQPGGPDTIHCLSPQSPEPLSYRLDEFGLTIEFLPSDFTQVNTEINRKMIPLALELLDVQADDTVMDLFCGLGNFSLPLATRVKHVIGVEGEAGLVQRARENARRNNIENIEFHVANLYEDFQGFSWAKQGVDKLLLDPPRSGALEVAQFLKKLKPKRIVYVSCGPATLARDIDEIVNRQGYKLRKVGVMDMFPHTAHVESIAVFERK
ncbi:MAG: 23S rRNA (uracil(1939)-C(5))-methyltransferase RlmD [Gammaproteobacteria bacterium]|nr:23S rRNA (uracil(1939)-C(5))-methyltransferase RlmD [Gammaproteobacteria bacterium]